MENTAVMVLYTYKKHCNVHRKFITLCSYIYICISFKIVSYSHAIEGAFNVIHIATLTSALIGHAVSLNDSPQSINYA